MKRKKKSRIALIGDLLVLLLAVPAIFILSFGSALLQEKDTFAILWTAARLQLSGSEIGPVGTGNQRWLMRSGHDYKPLEAYFRQRGWSHPYQKGGVGGYSRAGEKIYVQCKAYTAKYVICQADRQP